MDLNSAKVKKVRDPFSLILYLLWLVRLQKLFSTLLLLRPSYLMSIFNRSLMFTVLLFKIST